MNFLVVSDIDVYQLNLKPLKNLHFLVENPLQKGDFLHFLNNNCKIKFIFGKKTFFSEK